MKVLMELMPRIACDPVPEFRQSPDIPWQSKSSTLRDQLIWGKNRRPQRDPQLHPGWRMRDSWLARELLSRLDRAHPAPLNKREAAGPMKRTRRLAHRCAS